MPDASTDDFSLTLRPVFGNANHLWLAGKIRRFRANVRTYYNGPTAAGLAALIQQHRQLQNQIDYFASIEDKSKT